jgi:hypothetical protein
LTWQFVFLGRGARLIDWQVGTQIEYPVGREEIHWHGVGCGKGDIRMHGIEWDLGRRLSMLLGVLECIIVFLLALG